MFPIKYIENNMILNQQGEWWAYYEPVSYTHLWLNEGQLLLTDYAEGIEREWELIKFYSQLLAAAADWCIVFLKGAHRPKWTDGQELNYKRRRIDYQQEEMIAHGFFIPPEFADLPPEMDVNYMRGRENIKKNAKAALKPVSYTHLDVYKRQGIH